MMNRLSSEYGIKFNIKSLSPSYENNNQNFNNVVNNCNQIVNYKLVSVTKEKINPDEINPDDMIDSNNNTFFRGIPCDNDLFIIYNLASNHKLLKQETDIFGAFLLKWIKEKKVDYVIKTKGIFRKIIPMVYFKDNVVFDGEFEKKLYNFIKGVSKDNVLKVNEFNEWLNKKKHEFGIIFYELKNESNKHMISAGLLVKNNKDGNLYNDIQTDEKKFILAHESFTLTPKYKEYLQQIYDFKKYIKTFSLLHEKEIFEIEIWGDYLVVSQLLGITDEVSKQLDYLVPSFRTSNKYKIKIKVPGSVPKEQIEQYVKDEFNNKRNDLFKS